MAYSNDVAVPLYEGLLEKQIGTINDTDDAVRRLVRVIVNYRNRLMDKYLSIHRDGVLLY